MFRVLFLLPVCLIYSVSAIWAQNTAFEKITIDQGLSQGMVFDILQTRDGFLWVATKDGLNRYDGYNFKVFTNNPFDPFSLAQNNVNTLFEDSRGLIWVGLDSKGLDVFDPKTGRFHHFPLDYKGGVIVHGTDVRRIVELSDGSIWVLKLGIGLVRLAVPEDWKGGLPQEPVLEKLVKPDFFNMDMDINAKPLPEAILDLNLLANGDLLATSNHHQFRIDPRSGTYHVVNPGITATNTRWAAQGDEAFGGDLWAGQGQEIRRLRNGIIKSYIPARPFCNLCLSKGQKGHVWLSLCGKLWDLEPGEDLDFSKPDHILDNTITCLEQDRNGNLWLGTSGYGLRKINAIGKRFHTGGQGASVLGIWRDPAGRYYGKDISTIKSYNPLTGHFNERSAFTDKHTPLNEYCLSFDPDGSTWLLCRENGSSKLPMLRRYSAEGRLVKSYEFEADNLSDIMLRRHDGSIWFSTRQCNLMRFDPQTERFDQFNFAHLFGDKSGSVRVTALAEDGEGLLWVGTQSGLLKCETNTQNMDCQLFEANFANLNGLNNNSIASILPTADGQIWLGTKGGGINILNPQTGHCHQITIANGLLNNVVYGILPGNRSGEFWCSTNRGLAKIRVLKNDPFEFETTTFTAAVGLQDNEFNTNAYFKAANGELLFGGVNGLNRFFPEELKPDTMPPSVYIIGLEINQRKAELGMAGSPLTAPLEVTSRIELSFDQNNISFEFAALDLTDPSKNRYRYRLSGLENNWVEAGTSRFAHYTHLPPGNYQLYVQGSNGESAWREAKPLLIIINPPWYRSNLAFLCYFALLLWGAWRVYQFQIRRVKEREQLAFEQRETERLKALEQMKTNFFNNVTHEFRTPLTLMLEPLRLVLQKSKDAETLENVRLAEANSRKLLDLVNQLLDMSKLESGSMTLDLRRGDLGKTIREVFERFSLLAEKNGIKMTLRHENSEEDLIIFQKLSNMEYDSGKVELVLNNLISNALKFTSTGGEVEVKVERSSESSNVGGIEIRVRDTGTGIAPEHLSKIFERFYQVDNTHTRVGTGIGLALSKELAELMGGSITVESEVGKGSTFTFQLPVKDEDLMKEGNKGLSRQGTSKNLTTAQKWSGMKLDSQSDEQRLVLIIEDNFEMRNFIKKSIIDAGWQVVDASDGVEGVKKATEMLPDLVISDVMLPHKDGLLVVDELKNAELTAHIPIILLTAKSSIESRLVGLRRGADDYLIKPFNTEELLARMANIVEARRRPWAILGKQNTALHFVNNPEEAVGGEFLSAPDRDFLQKFTLVLEGHLSDETLGVEDFAQKMFISRMQLHRKLKALTDRSARDFIRDYRLNRAFSMLKNQEGRVGEIALRVGFGNEKYFSTAFKEKFGVSPSQI